MSFQEAERRAAYSCDVTYVTNSELGFDYLRDNLAQVSLLPAGLFGLVSLDLLVCLFQCVCLVMEFDLTSRNLSGLAGVHLQVCAEVGQHVDTMWVTCE